MKKIIFIVICAALTLTSCGAKKIPDTTTCEALASAAVAAIKDAPESDDFYVGGDGLFDTYTASLTFTSRYEEYENYSYISDYALYTCGSNETFEVDVLKADSADHVEALKNALNDRLEAISAGGKAIYDPDFQTLFTNAQIFTDGNYVFLLITSDNAAAKKAIDSFKK